MTVLMHLERGSELRGPAPYETPHLTPYLTPHLTPRRIVSSDWRVAADRLRRRSDSDPRVDD